MRREKEIIKRRLDRLCQEEPRVAEFILQNIVEFNGRPGVPSSFDLLDLLLQDQAYRLAFWRVAADEINYRRFFDVNELAAVCMERPENRQFVVSTVLDQFPVGLLTTIADSTPDD